MTVTIKDELVSTGGQRQPVVIATMSNSQLFTSVSHFPVGFAPQERFNRSAEAKERIIGWF